jgi:hypothetical protein
MSSCNSLGKTVKIAQSHKKAQLSPALRQPLSEFLCNSVIQPDPLPLSSLSFAFAFAFALLGFSVVSSSSLCRLSSN